MSWRLAYSLETLRSQVNARFPHRSKASDGTIGDEAHQSRDSDHNAWILTIDKEGRNERVVSALDLTNDPRNGFDAHKFAEALKGSGDLRIKYIISNQRIWNPSVSKDWRPYGGVNPHNKHIHISVKSEKDLYDSRNAWEAITQVHPTPDEKAKEVKNYPLLKRGSDGIEVDVLRDSFVEALRNEIGFGPLLEGIVKGFQAENGLAADGKVGIYTREKLQQKGILNEDG